MDATHQVTVLFNGYSKLSEDGKQMIANCTCTLIRGPKNIIIDTMTAWDGDRIVSALKDHNLTPQDIDWVICTHGHSDHIGNNSLFQNATHIVGTSISKRDLYYIHDFDNELEYVIDDKIKVIRTSGHTLSDVSVIVDTGMDSLGVVAIVGDLFEKEEDIENEKLWLEVAGSENPKMQRENRKKIIGIANYIIPGHGPIFLVTNNIKKQFLI